MLLKGKKKDWLFFLSGNDSIWACKILQSNNKENILQNAFKKENHVKLPFTTSEFHYSTIINCICGTKSKNMWTMGQSYLCSRETGYIPKLN